MRWQSRIDVREPDPSTDAIAIEEQPLAAEPVARREQQHHTRYQYDEMEPRTLVHLDPVVLPTDRAGEDVSEHDQGEAPKRDE